MTLIVSSDPTESGQWHVVLCRVSGGHVALYYVENDVRNKFKQCGAVWGEVELSEGKLPLHPQPPLDKTLSVMIYMKSHGVTEMKR